MSNRDGALIYRDLANLLAGRDPTGAPAAGVVAQAKASGLACVGVTGSSGKTSTKDLLGQVLAASAPTVSPPCVRQRSKVRTLMPASPQAGRKRAPSVCAVSIC